MKDFILSTVALATLTACPASQDRNSSQSDDAYGYLPIPDEAMAKRSGVPVKTLHIGFGVYVRECGQCHAHIFPDDLTDEEWHVTTPRMAWNANIDSIEQDALLKFMLAASDHPFPAGVQFEPME